MNLTISLSPRPVYRSFAAVASGLVALAVLAAPAISHGQSASALTPAKNSGKEYILAHPSAFNAPPANARNPFWPIGWVPSAAPVQVAAVAVSVKAEDFTVTTISLDAPALAVINGKTRAVGDQIPVTPDGRDFVTVKQILDGMVVLDYHGRELRASNNRGRTH